MLNFLVMDDQVTQIYDFAMYQILQSQLPNFEPELNLPSKLCLFGYTLVTPHLFIFFLHASQVI